MIRIFILVTVLSLVAIDQAANVVNGVDLDQACPKYAPMASVYCRASEDEPPAVKPKCDLYRKYCSNYQPSAPPGKCRQIAYCAQYAGQNSLICKNAAYANSSPDKQRFCQNYKALCDKVPEDENDECGSKNATAVAVRPLPNAFSGPMPSPGLYRPTDLNGGGPLATVGQSSLDNIKQNMASSAAKAPLFGILGGIAGAAAKAGGSAPGQAASGNFGDIGSALYSGSPAGGGGPTAPYGPGLGYQTIPGFEPAAQQGPFGTSPLWVGNNVGVGPFASAGQSTSVNPFGKVGWVNQWGAMGFSGYNGGGVDFGSVPGLTDLNNPLVGADAREDICSRLPWFSACHSNGNQQQPTLNGPTGASSSQADLPQPSTPTDDRTTFCKQYQHHYSYFCSNNGAGRGKAPDFCQSYSNNCNTKISPDSSPIQQNQNIRNKQKTSTTEDSSISNEDTTHQKVQYCTRYQTTYDNHCNGHHPTGRLATFCNAYKDYCNRIANVESSEPELAPKSRSQSFPNYNNSAQVRQLCDQYKWMANRSCPGFEVQDLREYCNMYRVYCLGKDPFPTIDGGLGWNKDNWGVAGIPYYPFNPQGAIGGGERNNVGFGDWGANFQQRKGVTDFWDQNKQVDANWQRGHYGVNNGWNIPLLGIGGYKNNDVNMGGLLNPGDWPAIRSGGVLPAMAQPSFGSSMMNGGVPPVNSGGGPLGGLGGLGGLGSLLG